LAIDLERKSMGHSQAEKAQSRERILDAAARKIREGGIDSVSVAELMKAANLTHGGFYGHFPSRAALIAAAVERAMDRGEESLDSLRTKGSPDTVKSLITRYLSPIHRDNIANGCGIAALGSDAARLDNDEVRALMASRAVRKFSSMAKAMGGGPAAEEAAVAAWCTMIGAIVVSRVLRGDKRADDILKYARRAVLHLEARVNADVNTKRKVTSKH
jgi:TetR/AcrR family transcriptional regulator, transcriptional repressor for nem operon